MGGWERPMVNIPKVRGWDILGPLPLKDYKKMIEEKELHYFPTVIMEYTDIGHDAQWVKEFTEWARGYPAGQDNFPEGVITSKPMIHKERDVECVDRIILFF